MLLDDEKKKQQDRRAFKSEFALLFKHRSIVLKEVVSESALLQQVVAYKETDS